MGMGKGWGRHRSLSFFLSSFSDLVLSHNSWKIVKQLKWMNRVPEELGGWHTIEKEPGLGNNGRNVILGFPVHHYSFRKCVLSRLELCLILLVFLLLFSLGVTLTFWLLYLQGYRTFFDGQPNRVIEQSSYNFVEWNFFERVAECLFGKMLVKSASLKSMFWFRDDEKCSFRQAALSVADILRRRRRGRGSKCEQSWRYGSKRFLRE